MEEKTIQKMVFDEIKKRDKIKLTDVADAIGISYPSMSDRMRSSISLKNFWEMLQVCGYDITISKAPENRDAMIRIGMADCENCEYKMWYEDMKVRTELVAERLEANKEAQIK